MFTEPFSYLLFDETKNNKINFFSKIFSSKIMNIAGTGFYFWISSFQNCLKMHINVNVIKRPLDAVQENSQCIAV